MKTVGIVGGGQLGMMLAEAATALGFKTVVLDPTPECPASLTGATQILGSLTDKRKIEELALKSDFLTWEIEHINTEILDNLLDRKININPSPATLFMIKDKLSQKEFLTENGIPVAPFQEVKNKEDILKVTKSWGYPLILKNRFGGYDGRGNFLIRSESEIVRAFEKLGQANLYIERFVDFERELAIMAVRDTEGEVKTYPVVETIHKNNILHFCLAPAPIPEKASRKAVEFAESVLKHLKGAGVFGIEMFLTKKGEILVNEIAPRVHNSGHYTIEGCQTSQFENHIRAITGMETGSCKMKVNAAVMVNILGEREGQADPQGIEQAEKLDGVYVHIYGKKQTKPERKMGHITVVDTSLEKALNKARKARSLITI